MEPPRRVLFLVAKVPKQGRSKTRLAQTIGPEKAELFSKACILDLCERLADAEFIDERVVLFAPGEERDIMDQLLTQNLRPNKILKWDLRPFVTSENTDEERSKGLVFDNSKVVGLGRGLCRALFDCVKDNGECQVAFIGMDTPQLTMDALQHSFSLRESKTSFIIRAKDGGYVLLSVRSSSPEDSARIFSSISWSTSSTKTGQVAALIRAGFAVNEYHSEFQDVDEYEDLVSLKSLLDEYSPSDDICPRVRALLATGIKEL